MKRLLSAFFVICTLAAPAAAAAEKAREAVSVTLSGSRASMLRQNRIAREEQYSFLRTPTQVRDYVDRGNLVELEGNADYAVIAGYPYARPVVRALVERLSSRYREACGERLVVTSLTRPSSRQPKNASPLSVHPAGMAVDLRVSQRAECRSWLMNELLELEEMGLLDATLERNPPHFHVAVFPSPFSEYDEMQAQVAAEAQALLDLEVAMLARADSMEAAAAEMVTTPAAGERPAGGMLLVLASLLARMFLPIVV